MQGTVSCCSKLVSARSRGFICGAVFLRARSCQPRRQPFLRLLAPVSRTQLSRSYRQQASRPPAFSSPEVCYMTPLGHLRAPALLVVAGPSRRVSVLTNPLFVGRGFARRQEGLACGSPFCGGDDSSSHFVNLNRHVQCCDDASSPSALCSLHSADRNVRGVSDVVCAEQELVTGCSQVHSCTGAAIFNSRCGGARTRCLVRVVYISKP